MVFLISYFIKIERNLGGSIDVKTNKMNHNIASRKESDSKTYHKDEKIR